MPTVYTAPERVPQTIGEPVSIFLAGSIEQDAAPEWQELVIDDLARTDAPVAVYNPRRASWDSSWVQSIENKEFNEQVTWELDQLTRADIVFFYFDPDTKSPISLMELGLVVGQNTIDEFPVIVVCPKGFWRKGNVDIMCNRAGITVVQSLYEGLDMLQQIVAEVLIAWAH